MKQDRITADALENQLSRFTATCDYNDTADADMAIEAVFEDVAVKVDVFLELAEVVAGEGARIVSEGIAARMFDVDMV